MENPGRWKPAIEGAVACLLCLLFMLLWLSPVNRLTIPSLPLFLGLPLGVCSLGMTVVLWRVLRRTTGSRGLPVLLLAFLLAFVVVTIALALATLLGWGLFGGSAP